MLRPTENIFEPGKQVQYDKQYAGDQMTYSYQKEERELQEKLFKMYEEMDDQQ